MPTFINRPSCTLFSCVYLPSGHHQVFPPCPPSLPARHFPLPEVSRGEVSPGQGPAARTAPARRAPLPPPLPAGLRGIPIPHTLSPPLPPRMRRRRAVRRGERCGWRCAAAQAQWGQWRARRLRRVEEEEEEGEGRRKRRARSGSPVGEGPSGAVRAAPGAVWRGGQR